MKKESLECAGKGEAYYLDRSFMDKIHNKKEFVTFTEKELEPLVGSFQKVEPKMKLTWYCNLAAVFKDERPDKGKKYYGKILEMAKNRGCYLDRYDYETAGNLKNPGVKCYAIHETASKVGMKEAFQIYETISEPHWKLAGLYEIAGGSKHWRLKEGDRHNFRQLK